MQNSKSNVNKVYSLEDFMKIIFGGNVVTTEEVPTNTSEQKTKVSDKVVFIFRNEQARDYINTEIKIYGKEIGEEFALLGMDHIIPVEVARGVHASLKEVIFIKVPYEEIKNTHKFISEEEEIKVLGAKEEVKKEERLLGCAFRSELMVEPVRFELPENEYKALMEWFKDVAITK